MKGVDRFVLAFSSGEQELIQYNGITEEPHLVLTEKIKEHEAPLTSLDYHRKLQYLLTSCKEGTLKLWDKDRRFLREINFPGKFESACFMNQVGDILISHD